MALYSFLQKCCRQVSGVAFDSYWSSPNSDGTGETVMYRFGSVGQVCKCCVSGKNNGCPEFLMPCFSMVISCHVFLWVCGINC